MIKFKTFSVSRSDDCIYEYRSTVFMNIDLGLKKKKFSFEDGKTFFSFSFVTFLGVFRNVLVLYLLDISAQRTEG